MNRSGESAEHERKDGGIVGPVQECMPGQPIGERHCLIDQVLRAHAVMVAALIQGMRPASHLDAQFFDEKQDGSISEISRLKDQSFAGTPA